MNNNKSISIDVSIDIVCIEGVSLRQYNDCITLKKY